MSYWIRFNKEGLEQYPVWIWNEERDKQIPYEEEIHSCILPADLEEFFVSSDFETSGGHFLSGYLVYRKLDRLIDIPRHPIFAIGVFFEHTETGFNRGLPDQNTIAAYELADSLGCSPDKIFPIYYHTPFHFEGQDPIEGYFNVKCG